MERLRRAGERGFTRTEWLESRHAFSFADYFDPTHVQFGSLRVFNDDSVAPGGGFPPHAHRNMEIVSYVVSGQLAHRDSTGGQGVLRAGEVQRMSAGTGVVHSEFNPSADEPLHFLQMWLIPERQELEPEYEQRGFPTEARRNKLLRVVSFEEDPGALRIHQRASMWLGRFGPGQGTEFAPAVGRHTYVHLIDGRMEVGGHQLAGGDALLLEEPVPFGLAAEEESEVLIWDLA